MTAEQTASLLNKNFELLASCIEAKGNPVDKFIGGSLISFWGAPEAIDDHAARALLAGTANQKAIVTKNFQHASADRQLISVHIDIQIRPAIVGDIGSKSRINYTVAGDTVNVAPRLEALSKNFELRD